VFDPALVRGGYFPGADSESEILAAPVAAFSHEGARISSLSSSVIGKACAKLAPHKVRTMNWQWIISSEIVSKHL
jgi:hypothetical protein